MSEENEKRSRLRSFTNIFRRRHRSSVSSGGTEPDDLTSSITTDDRSQDLSQLIVDIKHESHLGQHHYATAAPSNNHHYATVSGTGANLLRDLFHKKYESQTPNNVNVSKQKSKVRFKQDPVDEISRSESKGKKETRTRHVSIVDERYNPADNYKTYTGGYTKSNSLKMKSLFESFRQRSKTNADTLPPNIENFNAYVAHIDTEASMGKKKKKFKVTKTDVNSFGPDDFFQMYRNRTLSDSKNFQNMRARRASTSTLPPPPKANTIHSYEPLHLVIWRDKKAGNRVFRLPKTYTKNLEFEDANELVDSEDLLVVRFMNSHSCYDLMPSSTKLVILDIQLKVKKAFYALLLNGLHSAPLWCSDLHDTVGMLTISDFILILQKFHNSKDLKIEELEEQKIINWKEMIGKKCTRDRTIEVSPDATLLEAVSKLRCNAVHRVLVSEPHTGNALFILTYKNLLRHIFPYINSLCNLRIDFLNKTIGQLQIGSYQHMHAITYDHLLIDVINIFGDKNVSSLPVINVMGQVIDVYSKFDIFALALDSLYMDLQITIKEALKHRREDFEGLHTCVVSEKLITILSKFVSTGAHRIFVVSDRKELKGVISLSDVIDFLVSKPFNDHQERSRKQSDDSETNKLDSLIQQSSTIQIKPQLFEGISSSNYIKIKDNELKNRQEQADTLRVLNSVNNQKPITSMGSFGDINNQPIKENQESILESEKELEEIGETQNELCQDNNPIEVFESGLSGSVSNELSMVAAT